MDSLILTVIEKYNVKDLDELYEILCVIYPSPVVQYFNDNMERFKEEIGV